MHWNTQLIVMLGGGDKSSQTIHEFTRISTKLSLCLPSKGNGNSGIVI